MPLYSYNGMLLASTAGLAGSQDCCCDEPGCPACCDCSQYEFVLSGMGGGGNCSDLDGNWFIDKVEGSCSWTGTHNGISAILAANELPTADDPCGYYQLSIGPVLFGASTAIYRRNASDWDCSSVDACNVMTLISQTGSCGPWPELLALCCQD